jgi:hypothetical protein
LEIRTFKNLQQMQFPGFETLRKVKLRYVTFFGSEKVIFNVNFLSFLFSSRASKLQASHLRHLRREVCPFGRLEKAQN